MKVKEKSETGQEKPRRRDGGFILLLTQSAVVICILLTALLFRLIGGTAYAQLRESFAFALGDNTFAEAVVALFLPQEDTSHISE